MVYDEREHDEDDDDDDDLVNDCHHCEASNAEGMPCSPKTTEMQRTESQAGPATKLRRPPSKQQSLTQTPPSLFFRDQGGI